MVVVVVVFTRSRPARCVLLAVSIGAFAQRASSQLLSNVNGVLTLGFIAATGALFTEGVPKHDVCVDAQHDVGVDADLCGKR